MHSSKTDFTQETDAGCEFDWNSDNLWFEGYWFGLSIDPDGAKPNYNTVPLIKSEQGVITLESFVLIAYGQDAGKYAGEYKSNSMSLLDDALWYSYEKKGVDTPAAMGVSVYRFKKSDIENNCVNDLVGEFIDDFKKIKMKYCAMRINKKEYSILRQACPDSTKGIRNIDNEAAVKRILNEKKRLS